ncbi:MAG: HK97 gp10 family phage protein [Caldilineaceae bacterium]
MAKRPLPRPRAKPNQSNTMLITWYGDAIVNAIHNDINDALFVAAQMVIDAAAPKAPRDSGMLQESGYVATADNSTYHFDPKSHEKEVRPQYDGLAVAAFAAPHAHLIEYGTVNMRAQPFFRPAFDEQRREMGFAATALLLQAVKRAAG